MGMSFQVIANECVVYDKFDVSNHSGFFFLRMMGITDGECCGSIPGRDFLNCADGMAYGKCAPMTVNAEFSLMAIMAYGKKFAEIESLIARNLAIDPASDVHISYG